MDAAPRASSGDAFAIATMKNHWEGYISGEMLDAAKWVADADYGERLLTRELRGAAEVLPLVVVNDGDLAPGCTNVGNQRTCGMAPSATQELLACLERMSARTTVVNRWAPKP